MRAGPRRPNSFPAVADADVPRVHLSWGALRCFTCDGWWAVVRKPLVSISDSPSRRREPRWPAEIIDFPNGAKPIARRSKSRPASLCLLFAICALHSRWKSRIITFNGGKCPGQRATRSLSSSARPTAARASHVPCSGCTVGGPLAAAKPHLAVFVVALRWTLP